MNKYISAVIFLNEAEPFLLVEPFYRSFCQSYTSSLNLLPFTEI